MDCAELARRTRDDARLLAERAQALRDIADRVGGAGTAPDWFERTVGEHIERCLIAAGDLAEAADRLDEHARAISSVRTAGPVVRVAVPGMGRL
ncbi:hypothetical protein [Nocardia huaxiensis]|uniref:Uncharacterized protein n=1 Tax=Nocardia huaxiensis TaxID=2755382 RepID=A0A7D6VCE7_9NOCA|nr:hypothetical protein [Nocardia huaxiensis]QLY28935.1 hypothetical protein H0264_26905 [Nocardia huaxiensis]UFS97590.1 hypothetical protein LPY97_06695 [Nocardia huaxiensis]